MLDPRPIAFIQQLIRLLPKEFCDLPPESQAEVLEDIAPRIITAMDRAVTGGAEKVSLLYKNHKGETSWRTITPKLLCYGSSKWHPDPQWLIQVWDHDKEAYRDYSLLGFSEAGADGDDDEDMRALKEENERLRALVSDLGDEIGNLKEENGNLKMANGLNNLTKRQPS